MSPTALLAFASWIILTAVLFSSVLARRAILAAYVLGWLFLPFASVRIEGLPLLTKTSVINMVVLTLAAMVDSQSLARFRFHWIDLGMIVWCVVPFASSISNGLGAKDGLLELFNQSVASGVPYFLGRVYFRDAAALRDLATGILVGGLIYIPFCLWEIRMSPRLHKAVYGFPASQNTMSIRFGGYRPRVFMSTGLAVGLWMAAASLVAIWFVVTGSVRKVGGLSLRVILLPLLATTVLCKAFGALVLLVAGAGALLATRRLRTAWLLYAILLVPPAYAMARLTNMWSGEPVTTIVRRYINAQSAYSFDYRLRHEVILAEHALDRPLFGWAGWGRHQVMKDDGSVATKTDGWWMIALGKHGFVGLAAFLWSLLLPPFLVVRRIPSAWLSDGRLAGPVVLAAVIALYSIDCLLNAMPNPIFFVVTGGLAGWAATGGAVGTVLAHNASHAWPTGTPAPSMSAVRPGTGRHA